MIDLAKLATYPQWKILEGANNFSGFYKDFFKFLDSVQPEPEKYKPPQIEYKNNAEHECGVKLLRGIKEILMDENIQPGEHKKEISELNARLRGEYPQFANNLRS